MYKGVEPSNVLKRSWSATKPFHQFLFFSFAFWSRDVLSTWRDNQYPTWLREIRYLKWDKGRSATIVLRRRFWSAARWSDYSKAIWVHLTPTFLFALNEQTSRGGNKRCYFSYFEEGVAIACTSKEPKIPASNPNEEQITTHSAWTESNFICKNLIFNGLTDELYDYYNIMSIVKEVWDVLQKKYDTLRKLDLRSMW